LDGHPSHVPLAAGISVASGVCEIVILVAVIGIVGIGLILGNGVGVGLFGILNMS
jgi:hypothetical protein